MTAIKTEYSDGPILGCCMDKKHHFTKGPGAAQPSATNLLPEIGNPSAKPTDLQATRAARLLEKKVQTTPY